MVVDRWRLVLIEPDNKRLGYGVVRLVLLFCERGVGKMFYFIFVHRFLADLSTVLVDPDANNTRALVVRITSPGGNVEVFSGRFVYDDHIRCVAARQVIFVFC